MKDAATVIRHPAGRTSSAPLRASSGIGGGGGGDPTGGGGGGKRGGGGGGGGEPTGGGGGGGGGGGHAAEHGVAVMSGAAHVSGQPGKSVGLTRITRSTTTNPGPHELLHGYVTHADSVQFRQVGGGGGGGGQKNPSHGS